jgi:hypothetical protein
VVVKEAEGSSSGSEALKYFAPHISDHHLELFLRPNNKRLLGFEQLLQLTVHNFVHATTGIFAFPGLNGKDHKKFNQEIHLLDIKHLLRLQKLSNLINYKLCVLIVFEQINRFLSEFISGQLQRVPFFIKEA